MPTKPNWMLPENVRIVQPSNADGEVVFTDPQSATISLHEAGITEGVVLMFPGFYEGGAHMYPGINYVGIDKDAVILGGGSIAQGTGRVLSLKNLTLVGLGCNTGSDDVIQPITLENVKVTKPISIMRTDLNMFNCDFESMSIRRSTVRMDNCRGRGNTFHSVYPKMPYHVIIREDAGLIAQNSSFDDAVSEAEMENSVVETIRVEDGCAIELVRSSVRGHYIRMPDTSTFNAYFSFFDLHIAPNERIVQNMCVVR